MSDHSDMVEDARLIHTTTNVLMVAEAEDDLEQAGAVDPEQTLHSKGNAEHAVSPTITLIRATSS